MAFIWRDGIELPQFRALEGSIKTDVLIVGGGMAGILCAHFLQEKGMDYVLVEGRRICDGITQNTTAKITAQHGLIYHKLLKNAGLKKAKLYYEANQNAVKKFSDLCENMDCDFERKLSYVYSLENRRQLEEEAEALRQIGGCAELLETNELPFKTAGAVGLKSQAQFHPLKFISQIAKELNIYENSFVRELKGNTAMTDRGKIEFQKIIFATHFPIDNKHGMYYMKMYQHRSYVIALENVEPVSGMYVGEDRRGMSFRSYKNLLLVGGGSHRTGKKGGNWQELREFVGKYYPNAVEKYHWAAQDCMTLDGVPYIGQYAKGTPDYYVATGFNKWGMTSSMVAAMILSDLVTGGESPYTEVFSPSRSMFKPQLFVNGCEAIANLLTITKKRCPHLGCALKWNQTEHSWDCPCHGSRFNEKGEMLDNPANGDAKWQAGSTRQARIQR